LFGPGKRDSVLDCGSLLPLFHRMIGVL
jgi:hypothetical protein